MFLLLHNKFNKLLVKLCAKAIRECNGFKIYRNISRDM